MDWESFIPPFFGVLAAFVLQWLGRRYEKGKDKAHFLQDVRKELESCSQKLTGEGNLLPKDIWDSGKASGWLSLLSHEVKVQLASVYFRIECHNYEAEKVREVSILAATTQEKPKAEIDVELPETKVKVETPWTHAELLHSDLTVRLKKEEVALKGDIDNLLKQDIWEVTESEPKPKGRLKGAKWRKWLKKTQNAALILSLTALCFTGLNSLHDWFPPPQRAKLTVFIEHYSFYQGTANELNFDIWGKVTNDSPLTALVRRWGLFISVNISYSIMSYSSNMPDLSLSPSEQVNYTMGQVLWGDNETRIPETAVKGCIAWIEYEDHIGLQTARGELNFQ